MAFIDEMKAKAKTQKKLIVLPESEDDRTYHAAAQAIKEGIADLVMIGKEDEIKARAEKLGTDISAVKTVDPATSDKLDAYVDTLVELRKKKGMTPEKARETLLSDYPTPAMPTHKEAIKLVLDALVNPKTGAIKDLKDCARNRDGFIILHTRYPDEGVRCRRRCNVCRLCALPGSDI